MWNSFSYFFEDLCQDSKDEIEVYSIAPCEPLFTSRTKTPGIMQALRKFTLIYEWL